MQTSRPKNTDEVMQLQIQRQNVLMGCRTKATPTNIAACWYGQMEEWEQGVHVSEKMCIYLCALFQLLTILCVWDFETVQGVLSDRKQRKWTALAKSQTGLRYLFGLAQTDQANIKLWGWKPVWDAGWSFPGLKVHVGVNKEHFVQQLWT